MLPSRYPRTLSAIGNSICRPCYAQRLQRPTAFTRVFSSAVRREADMGTFSRPRPSLGYSFSQHLGVDDAPSEQANNPYKPDEIAIEPHHFNVYSTRHNTHITFTKPNRDPIISVSAGNIGFKKGGRGSYDAAYQLCAFVLSNIQEKGLLPQIKEMEVVFRGFGEGREAVKKVLLGAEGINIRGKVTKITDSTRLKFGGSRSPNPRRLG